MWKRWNKNGFCLIWRIWLDMDTFFMWPFNSHNWIFFSSVDSASASCRFSNARIFFSIWKPTKLIRKSWNHKLLWNLLWAPFEHVAQLWLHSIAPEAVDVLFSTLQSIGHVWPQRFSFQWENLHDLFPIFAPEKWKSQNNSFSLRNLIRMKAGLSKNEFLLNRKMFLIRTKHLFLQSFQLRLS